MTTNETKTENLETLRFLSETHRALHKQRQMYEFRALFTALTFYAVIMGAGLSGKLSVPPERSFIVWFGLLCTGVLVSIVLFFLHRSNRVNITLAEKCEVEMIMWLNVRGCDIKVQIPFRAAQNRNFERNWMWQSFIVIGFAILAAIALT